MYACASDFRYDEWVLIKIFILIELFLWAIKWYFQRNNGERMLSILYYIIVVLGKYIHEWSRSLFYFIRCFWFWILIFEETFYDSVAFFLNILPNSLIIIRFTHLNWTIHILSLSIFLSLSLCYPDWLNIQVETW